MLNDFHIGNRKSRIVISDPGMSVFRAGNYNPGMNRQLGTRHPSRLFIKEWINKRELEQDEVADRMGNAPPTLSKLLNGKMAMTTDYLAKIADALDVSVIQLFRDPSDPASASDFSEEDILAARAFLKLKSPLREHVLGLVEQLPQAGQEPKASDPGSNDPKQPRSE